MNMNREDMRRESKTGSVSSYDSSPARREKHDLYMQKYREGMQTLRELVLKLQDVADRKDVVAEFVDRTVNDGYKNDPIQVLAELRREYNI